jgi:hypothetical protein
MMEDGADILFLATDPSDTTDVLTQVSMHLTTICGLSFIRYNLFRARRTSSNVLDEE